MISCRRQALLKKQASTLLIRMRGTALFFSLVRPPFLPKALLLSGRLAGQRKHNPKFTKNPL
jgi:hypothetical protein